jgi:multiple sugar transport system substrate-binding protein
MRKINKRVRGAALLATAALLLTACGGGDEKNDAPADTTDGAEEPAGDGGEVSEEPVTIRFTWLGSDERAATTQQVIEEFQKEYPHITVQGEPKSFDGYFDTLATQMAAGDAPDVITFGGSYVLEYGARGALVDLNTLSTMDMSPFNESILASSTVDGVVYGAPTGGNTVAVIANPAIFEAAGVEMPDDDSWTWEEFVQIANDISAGTPEGTYGVEMRPYDVLGAYAAQQTDGGLYNMDGGLEATPDVLEAYWDMELSLLDGGGMPSAELTSEVMMAGVEQTLMGQGKSAMIMGYSNQVGDYATASGQDLVLLRISAVKQQISQAA